jgi:hypothetical protein
MAVDFEATVSLGMGKLEDIKSGVSDLRRPKPIHKAVFGSVQFGATPPAVAIIECAQRPQAGRIWNVFSTSIFGADGHTPLGTDSPAQTQLQAQGTATAPAANANISGNTGVATIGTTYLVQWTVGISGTPASPADANNFKLDYGAAAIITPSINAAAVGTWTQAPIYYTPTTASNFKVNNIGAATAGTVYSAVVQATAQESSIVLPGTFADIYAGMLVSDTPVTQQVLTDEITAAAVIPSINYYPRQSIWIGEMCSVYALIYNPPANAQVVLTARVAEYDTRAIEATRV